MPEARTTPHSIFCRKALLVSSHGEDQFDAAVVDQAFSLAETRSHHNTVSALCTLVSHSSPQVCPLVLVALDVAGVLTDADTLQAFLP